MKKRLISTYITGLMMMSSLWGVTSPLAAQEKVSATSADKPKLFLYQGMFVGVDLYGPATHALGSDFLSSEVSLEANLSNKYFPVVEIGYGKTDATDDETNIHFKTSAPYFRIGAGYNVFHKKPHLPGQFIIGARYGYSSFKYDVDAPSMTDPVWGGTTIPFSYQGLKSNASWFELVASLKTNVYKNFYLGLSVRYRSLINVKKSEHSDPWYIPGFGKNKSTNFGVTYNLIYKLPF